MSFVVTGLMLFTILGVAYLLRTRRVALLLTALLLIASLGPITHAQGNPPSTPLTPGADLPNQTLGIFLSYDAYNTPHSTGGVEVQKKVLDNSFETLMSLRTAFTPIKKPRGAVGTTVTVEVDQVILHTGTFHLLAIGALGGSIGSNSSGNGSTAVGDFSGGTGFIYQPPKNKFIDYVKVRALAEKNALASTQTLGRYDITFQKVFGK